MTEVIFTLLSYLFDLLFSLELSTTNIWREIHFKKYLKRKILEILIQAWTCLSWVQLFWTRIVCSRGTEIESPVVSHCLILQYPIICLVLFCMHYILPSSFFWGYSLLNLLSNICARHACLMKKMQSNFILPSMHFLSKFANLKGAYTSLLILIIA